MLMIIYRVSYVMLACLLMVFGFFGITATAQQKPNIVFILTDDQRFQGTINALGGQEVITPVMDALAKGGTAFTNAYIMGGSQPAVCTPSRNMIMTGRNLFSIGNAGMVISPDNITIGEALRADGYFTYGIGKWHNDKASFNRSFRQGDEIFYAGMGDHFNKPLFHFDASGLYNDSITLPNSTKRIAADHVYPGKHSSEIFSEAAVRFIKGHKSVEPFFLYVGFTSPHDPKVMPDQYKGRYDTSNISVPVNFMPKHPFNNGELKIRDEMLASFPRDPAEIKIHIRDYYAMLSHMDDEIGKIIQSLKESGLYENTIIVLAGDNGLALGQHGLMGKQNLYEHSIKVPLIFSGRNIPKGKINTSFVYTMDIFPTICNLTNITVPPSVQGKVILGKKVQQRTSLFYAYRDFQRAVRKGDWKMIVYQVKGQETIQLFNIKQDPFELNDLANDHHYTNKIVEMKIEMSSQKELNNDVASVKIN